MFPDGRFLLEVVGDRRFFSEHIMEMDGYCASKYSILNEFNENDNISSIKTLLMNISAKLGHAGLDNSAIALDSLEELNNSELRNKAMEISFKVGAFLHNVDSYSRQELLEITSTEVRLKKELAILESYVNVVWCSIV
jgi:ATP-dependent Lon protease